jgi:hypothetical protein
MEEPEPFARGQFLSSTANKIDMDTASSCEAVTLYVRGHLCGCPHLFCTKQHGLATSLTYWLVLPGPALRRACDTFSILCVVSGCQSSSPKIILPFKLNLLALDIVYLTTGVFTFLAIDYFIHPESFMES